MNTFPRNPVVLVHGWTDTAIIFDRMAKQLSALGWTVYSLDLIPSNGDLPLSQLAQQVTEFVDRHIPTGAFDLIGFSMGGLVSRYYVQRLGGIQRVQRLITISSPHNGTIAAYASTRPGCVQMRPNSSFLNDLNRDLLMLEQINFTSIWTPLDLMILPARSSDLPVGRKIQIPVTLHAWMVTDARVIKTIAATLEEPIRARQLR
jgi:triacylglycerol lipase